MVLVAKCDRFWLIILLNIGFNVIDNFQFVKELRGQFLSRTIAMQKISATNLLWKLFN